VLHDLKEYAAARLLFRDAVALAAQMADAHFYLALTLLELVDEATGHWGNVSPVVAPPPMQKWCGPRSCSWPMSTRAGATRPLPGPWAAPIGRCASGGGAAGRGRRCRTRLARGDHAFFPSAVRAQVTALACTLPRDSGKPLSRWSTSELARAVVRRGIVRRISGATIQRWLQADRIKPWRYHSWQRTTDPRFLERAIPKEPEQRAPLPNSSGGRQAFRAPRSLRGTGLRLAQ
jgi:hypothetical protein